MAGERSTGSLPTRRSATVVREDQASSARGHPGVLEKTGAMWLGAIDAITGQGPGPGKGPGKGEHARSSQPRRRRGRTDRNEIAGPCRFEIEEHRLGRLGQNESHQGHRAHLVDRVDELFLLLLPFLLLARLDRRAEGTRVFPIEGFLERPGEITLLGAQREHPHPRDHLQGQPVNAEEVHSGEQRKAFGKRRLQSVPNVIPIASQASENSDEIR